MSTPWIPRYSGSWGDFINSLLYNAHLGGAPSPPPAPTPPPGTPPPHPEPHPEFPRRMESSFGPWCVSEPNPSPWRIAVATLVALVGTRQVAHGLPDGRL